jgi:hypothetical protein
MTPALPINHVPLQRQKGAPMKYALESLPELIGEREIPEDVMKAATECVAELKWNEDWPRVIALAILAERQRHVTDDGGAIVRRDGVPVCVLKGT